VLADQHAGGGLVGERRVVAEPELGEERLAAVDPEAFVVRMRPTNSTPQRRGVSAAA